MMSNEDLYNMSDEELALAFKEAKQSESMPSEDTPQEVEQTTEETVEQQEVSQDTPLEQTEQVEQVEQNQQEQAQQAELHRVKANGKEYDFSLDELLMLAPKALDYTKKTQALAPYRKMVSAMEENGITNEDINMLIDMKKGNKEAIGYFLKGQSIDPLDLSLDEEVQYKPNEYGQSEQSLNFKDTVTRLSSDNEFARTQQIVSQLDNDSKQAMFADPSLLEGLHIDVKNGIFDKVIPVAEKLAVLDGYKKSLLDYYIEAGVNVYKQINEANQQTQAKKEQDQAFKKEARQAASLPKVNHQNSRPKVMDYLNASDEEYEAWYKELSQRM